MVEDVRRYWDFCNTFSQRWNNLSLERRSIRIVGFRRHKGRRAVPIDGSGWMDTQRATLLRSIIHYLPVFRYGINILGAWCEVEWNGERCTSGRLQWRATSVSEAQGTDTGGIGKIFLQLTFLLRKRQFTIGNPRKSNFETIATRSN